MRDLFCLEVNMRNLFCIGVNRISGKWAFVS